LLDSGQGLRNQGDPLPVPSGERLAMKKNRSRHNPRTRTLRLLGTEDRCLTGGHTAGSFSQPGRSVPRPACCTWIGVKGEMRTSLEQRLKTGPPRNGTLRHESSFAKHSPLTAPYPISFLHSRACSGLEETDAGGVTKFMTREILTLEGGGQPPSGLFPVLKPVTAQRSLERIP
jgi:hypothetical protein